MPRIDLTHTAVTLVLAVPPIYLLLVALGRWLKRRAGVRLGILYQLFCVALAFFLPLGFLDVPFALVQSLGSVVAVLGTIFALALVRRFVWEYYFPVLRGITVPKYIQDVVALAVFIVAFLFVLTFIYEVRIPGLLAGSGIVAVMLGLAMQDTLGNILAGFSLHFGKPFKPGDWLIIDNRHAEVIEINWRSTRLRTNDNVFLDVPNSQINKQTVINLYYPDRLHAMRLTIGLDYRVPPNEVKDALLRAAANASGVTQKPSPKVFLTGFGEFATQYEIKFWMEDHSHFNDVSDAIRTNIWYELQRRQIRIPFPIRTLQIEAPDAAWVARTPEATRNLLSRQALFQCLDEEQRDGLLSRGRQLRFGRGERIIEQGSEGDSMFILLQGEAAVSVQSNGEVTRVAGLRAGDCFGEMSLLTGARRSATVIAQTDCEVMEIEKASMGEILQAHPELLRQLSELLARRQMENEGLLAESAQKKPASQRQQEFAESFLARLTHFFEL